MKRLHLVAIVVLFAACDPGGVTLLADSTADTAKADAAPADTAPVDVPADVPPDTPPLVDAAQELPPDVPQAELVEDLPSPDVPPSPCLSDAACDDDDKCTLDRCQAAVCVNDLLPPGFCCADDDDCEDGVPCTVDQCLNGACWNLPEDSTCCTLASDCKDFNDCTVDLCIGSTCAHVFASDDAACTCDDWLDCDDGLPCTEQSCVGGVCTYAAASGVAGCCGDVADCDDGDPATEDVCQQYTCGNAPWGLCILHTHCEDGDPCTMNSCLDGICASALLDGCCHVDAQCTDELASTTDLCVAGDCLHTLPAAPESCGSAAECPPGPACLVGACVQGQCSYAFQIAPGCCTGAGACDDGDPCTTDTCGADLLCTSAPLSGLVKQVLWDFGDPALPGFDLSGGAGPVGWGVSFAMFVSPPRSLYFGDPAKGNFATGGAVAGEARTPQVQLPDAGPITLKGATYIDVEPLFSRDLVWISVESAGGAVSEIWNKEAVGGTTAQAWLPLEAELSAFAGQAVRIVFGFDSIDAVDNFGEGIYFDDISLWWSCGG
ncbi:MAG: hypothetical protein ABIK09_18620 [Pseudomonadota bacterium]